MDKEKKNKPNQSKQFGLFDRNLDEMLKKQTNKTNTENCLKKQFGLLIFENKVEKSEVKGQIYREVRQFYS